MAAKKRKKRRNRHAELRRNMIIGAAAIAGAVVLLLFLTGKLKSGGVFTGQSALLTAASTVTSADSASGAAGKGAEADAGGDTAAGGAGVNAIDLEATSGLGAGTNSAGNTPAPESAAEHPWHTPLERYFMDKNFWRGCPERNVQLLTPNEYSRPEIGIDAVNDIVVHYVDEPGSTAMQNRDYFESLKDGSGRSVSSHFVISLDGEIVQCVPLGEVAYASNHRNHDTISIECCHPDDTGKFTDETYISCVNLCAWLCWAFEISPDHVIRHYDVTEKECPIYYVHHPEAWEALKNDVAERYEKYEQELGKV